MNFKTFIVQNGRTVQLAEANVYIGLCIIRANSSAWQEFNPLTGLLFHALKCTQIFCAPARQNPTKAGMNRIFDALFRVSKFIKGSVEHTGKAYRVDQPLALSQVELTLCGQATKYKRMSTGLP